MSNVGHLCRMFALLLTGSLLLSQYSLAAPINPDDGVFGVLEAPSSNDFNGAVQQGFGLTTFTDTYTFTLADAADIHVAITEYDNFEFAWITFGIREIGGAIAGEPATGTGTDFTVANLTVGDYELVIEGKLKSFGLFEYGYAGVLDVLGASGSPSAVPLPAAAWLFGSALFGLVAVARRRAVK